MSGPHSIVDNPGGAAAPSVDTRAATLVVNATGAQADFTTIEAALAALPAAGGVIFVREGSYTPPPGGYVQPAAPVRIICAGIDATEIDLGAAANAVFNLSGYSFALEEVTVLGASAAGQTLIANAAPAVSDPIVSLFHVKVGDTLLDDLEVIIDANSQGAHFRVTDCYLIAQGPDPYLLKDGGNGDLYMVNTDVKQGGGISGTIACQFANCSIASGTNNLTFAAPSRITSSVLSAPTIAFGNSCQAVGTRLLGAVTLANECELVGVNHSGGAITTTGVLNKISASILLSFAATGGGMHSILGNDFFGGGNNCTLTGTTNCTLVGNENMQVLEVGAADGNVYAENKGFGGSTIIGPNSVVEGARKTQVVGAATLGAFTAVAGFPRTSMKGMVGIGTIKNTGANGMEVREVVTDAFGVTVTTSPVVPVPAGGDYMLDPQTNFTDGVLNARPPYLSYSVEVRHPGVATTYDLQFTAQGTVI